MEFTHAVLLIVHIEECEDVARVGVEVVERFGVRFFLTPHFEFDDGGFHGADASQAPGCGDELIIRGRARRQLAGAKASR